MSMSESERPKDSFLHDIFSICTTLTPEATAAASEKAKELGFDVDRGIVSLRETFINLSSARMVLEDAIEKEKLVQLPITVQKEVLTNLEGIAKALKGLTDGVDEVVNLTNAVETLNTSIWKYGLHNLSDEVLGYQKKINELKRQEVRIAALVTQLDLAIVRAQQADSAANEIEQRKTDALSFLDGVKQSSATASTLLEQIRDTGTQANTLRTSIQQHEKQSSELSAHIQVTRSLLGISQIGLPKFRNSCHV